MTKLRSRRIARETSHSLKGAGHALKALGAAFVNGATFGLAGGKTIEKERAASDAEIGKYYGMKARRKALENIERKQKGGSAALRGKRADAGAIKGSGSSDVATGGSGSDRLQKRTVSDKYDHATSQTGKRIMAKAKGERSSSRYFRGLGHASNMGGGAAMVSGALPAGAALLAGGSASHIKATAAARQAEDLRLKSRGVDALVNKARTGNTLGANLSTKDAAAFADASHKYHTAGRTAPAADGTGDWQNVGEGRRGFGNPNNQKAAQEARRAKGLVK